MDDGSRGDAESELRAAFERGDLHTTATLALSRYGPEVLRFLAERLRDEHAANEVFSQFVEDFWKGLPKFAWRASLRSWAYTLARHAADRYARGPWRRQRRMLPLPEGDGVLEVAERLRSETLVHLRSIVKQRVRTLREALAPDDQLLLTLRVDKQMPWVEIALVLEETRSDADRTAHASASARVRQRFAAIKARLRRLAVREGLLDD
jgi:RNA polymerase sigma-70 factor (ECF subfamily)